MKKTISIMLTVAMLFTLSADEYFVSVNGNDQNSGTSKNEAFATAQKGVSILKPGDSLIIMPGEYHESIRTYVSGSKDKSITIKAEKPGTAILRGDVTWDSKKFSVYDKANNVYVTDFKGDVYGVNERDSLTLYRKYDSMDRLKSKPASFYHDKASGKVYIRTSDGYPPERHLITISDLKGCGLFIGRQKLTSDCPFKVINLTIDGLVFTGYRALSVAPAMVKNNPNGGGLVLAATENCVVKNCVVFLCDYGIEMRGLLSGASGYARGAKGWQEFFKKAIKEQGTVKSSVIENCLTYGNGSHTGSSHANFGIFYLSKDSEIRNCASLRSINLMGMRFYSGYHENITLDNNIAFDCNGIWFKTNKQSGKHCVRGNISDRVGLQGLKSTDPNVDFSSNFSLCENTPISKKIKEQEKDFAAPLYFDYRAQSDSEFSSPEKAPFPNKNNQVFFISPNGNDENSGTSVSKAWKTLGKAMKTVKKGATVYLAPGTYNEELAIIHKNAVAFKRRTWGEVVVKSVRIEKADDVEIQGITVMPDTSVTEAITVKDCLKVKVTNCVTTVSDTGLAAENCPSLSARHCIFANKVTGVKISDSKNAELVANIFSGNSDSSVNIDKSTVENGLFCDYNSHSREEDIIIESGSFFSVFDDSFSLTDWREKGLGVYSIVANPEFSSERKGCFYLKNAYAFNGRGPLGTPIGPWERRPAPISELEIIPRIHSVTPSTVNVEWNTHGILTFGRLKWGKTEACENIIRFKQDYIRDFHIFPFHSFSVTGLDKGTNYFCKSVTGTPVKEFFNYKTPNPSLDGKSFMIMESKALVFKTPLEEAPAKTYHVEVDGDDQNDGLRLETAWKSISHAAAKAMPGDTVLVHDGTYTGNIVIRNTGTKGRPITFKAVTPGAVFINSKNIYQFAVRLNFKSHIVIDGFYMMNCYSDGLLTPQFCGAVDIFGGEDNIIRCCILDSRATHTKRPAIFGETRDLTIENCVIRNGWGWLVSYCCPGLKLINNVFYGCMVSGMSLTGDATLSHNIICAQTPKKRLNQLVSVGGLDNIKDEYNCYFTRLSPEEKTVYRHKVTKEKFTLDKFREATGQAKTSFFGNPGMKILPEYLTRKMGEGIPHPYLTQELNMKVVEKDGKRVKVPIIYLFDDFFATNPKCLKAEDGRPIGLDQSQFKTAKKTDELKIDHGK